VSLIHFLDGVMFNRLKIQLWRKSYFLHQSLSSQNVKKLTQTAFLWRARETK